MSKVTEKITLPNFLWDWLKTCAVYWFVFCIVEYVHRGRYDYKKELILAVVISLIVPSLRRLFYVNKGGIRPLKPDAPTTPSA